MRFDKKKILGISALLVALITPLVMADVIYFYTGTINVATTTPPISLAVGPNGNENGYISTSITGYDYDFTATVYITNSTYDYYYQFLEITAKSNVYIYFNTSTSSNTSTYIDNAWIVVQNSKGTIVSVVPIISAGKAVAPSSSISLSSGTYYLSLIIQPVQNSLPETPSKTPITTFYVSIGANVVSSTAVPLPPL